MKIITVVGARPQFIKAAAFCRAVQQHNLAGHRIEEILVHTGQHYDQNMSENFFQEMKIPKPHYHLGIGGCSHGMMTGRMLEEIEKITMEHKPDWMLVYGDTNSTLAGALAAAKLHVPVAHVEAGLRSFNRKMPEEINRILVDQCSEVLFTPTKKASEQLVSEGIPIKKIHEVGDIMYDVAMFYQQRSAEESTVLAGLHLKSKEFALATVHRAENTDDVNRLKEIFFGLNEISKLFPVVVPLHPRTKQILEKLHIIKEFSESLLLIDPVSYLDMIQLESNAKLILTDSGGVQKEAYFYKVPCLTLREETEWVELVSEGYNTLVKADREKILGNALKVLNGDIHWKKSLYGNGTSSVKILDRLKSGFNIV